MAFIDSVILDLTERSCQRFQLLTGRTNLWLAVQLTNLSIVVYFVWAALYTWGSNVVRLLIGVFCGGLLYVLTQTVLKEPIEASEQAAYRRVARGFRNPRRLRDVVLRVSFLMLSVTLSYPVVFVYITLPRQSVVYLNLRLHIVLLSYALVLLTTAVLYLLACDPLPPCAGKLKVWLGRPVRARLASVAEAPESRTQPARVSRRRPVLKTGRATGPHSLPLMDRQGPLHPG